MAPQPHNPIADSAEHAATYIVALVFTDSGHLRTTLVVTPVWSLAAVGEADTVLRQGKFRIKEGSNLFVVEV